MIVTNNIQHDDFYLALLGGYAFVEHGHNVYK